jgi:hypothetical protein
LPKPLTAFLDRRAKVLRNIDDEHFNRHPRFTTASPVTLVLRYVGDSTENFEVLASAEPETDVEEEWLCRVSRP